jgi:uncharacterized sulfatase
MRISLLLALALLRASALGGDRPPNIVLILADDLGYGQLGCYGQKLAATPHLDRMAAEGVRFDRFYAGSTVCAPSRSVLMTGLHTGHTRVRGNASGRNRDAQNLKAGDLTLAQVMKNSGYRTALIGKWGLGTEGSEGVPNKKGFDYFYGYLDQTHAHNPYPPFIFRNDVKVPLRNGLVPGSDARMPGSGGGIAATPVDYVPDLMTGEVLNWVKQAKNQPFFLFWSLITPHANNEGTKYGRGQEVPGLGGYEDKPWPHPDKAHAATIGRMDSDVGRLLALLGELHIDEHTLVLFTSDNGPHQEGGNNPDLFDANGPLRGLKRDLTDGGIRVPAIARWPRTTPAGGKISRFCGFQDILPTFADMAGEAKSLPGNLDGQSIAGLLRGIPGELPPRGPFYWEFHEKGFSQAVIIGERWKAIRPNRFDAPVRIYDLIDDQGETTDLASTEPDLVAKAKALFQSERTDMPEWPVADH